MIAVSLRRVAVAVGLAAIVGQALAAGPANVADVAEPLLDAVVNISTAQTVDGSDRGVPVPRVPEGSPFQEFFDEFFGRNGNGGVRPRRVQSLGSGFVIDAEGIVVTNNHVIEGADEISVIFNDGTKLVATLIGADDKTDIAVLKVEPETPLVAVPFGDSDHLRVGDWVMAIGNPFGLGGTVTLGIVSARNRNIDAGPYDNFIQTDASINRGNSGGPLFNMDGEVVGINTAIISPTGGSIGIGFAVPSVTAMNVIDQLQRFGETRRGWLGVRIQNITETMAEGLGLDAAAGALVAGVTVDGPAEAAGLVAGDIILTFDGQAIDDADALPRIVADKPIGAAVQVTVLRGDERMDFDVTLGRLEDAERVATAGATDEPTDDGLAQSEGPLGLTLAELNESWRSELEIVHDLEGVAVVDVAPGSAAEEKRIRPGDIVVEISQVRVESAADVRARVDELIAEGRTTAMFLLANRQGDLRFVAVTIDG